jgi:hypothetical protein
LNRIGQAAARTGAVRRRPVETVLLVGALLLGAPGLLWAEPGLSLGDGRNPGLMVPEAPGEPPPREPLAQSPGSGADSPMFQRFLSGRDASKTWQTMFEIPVALQPQSEPGAHVVANEGLNWVTSYQPLNRVYFGRSIGYARMVWQPGGRLDTTEVVQWDWSEIITFAVQPWWVISVGAGAGFMDGLIFYKNGGFKHRFEVFLPVQFGTGLRLGKSWFVGAKVLQSSYFGPGPVASAARIVVGVGHNY